MSTNSDNSVSAADVDEVLSHLDGEWATEQRHPHYVLATRSDGFALGFHRFWGVPDGKVKVSVQLTERLPYGETAPEVNVTITRKPEVVARDLAKRLLPDAEAMHRDDMARAEAGRQYAATIAANVECLGVDSEDARIYHTGGVYGDVKVYGESANLVLNSVPIELAAEILDMVRSANCK